MNSEMTTTSNRDATLRGAVKTCALLSLALTIGCGAGTRALETETAQTMPTPLANDSFLEQWAMTGGFRLGHPTRITFTPDGETILFLRSGARDNQRDLFAYTIATGEERVLVDADTLLSGEQEELSAEERALRERLRMTARGIASFSLSRDGTKILIPLSGKLFIFGRESGEVTELPSDGGYANDPQMSPSGEKVACVRDGDLYVIDIASRSQERLTERPNDDVTHGLAEFVAQEEMSRYHGYWWSPDSQTIVFQQNDNSGVELLYASNPIDPAQAPHGSRYPRVGTDNAVVKLGLIPASGGDITFIEWDREAFEYVATVRWDRDALRVLVQDRRQRVEQLLHVNVESGATERVLEERDDRWLNLSQSVPRRHGDGFLWFTERDGHARLERRSASGAVTLNPGAVEFASLLHAKRDQVWFAGSEDPTERHIYRVDLTDGQPSAPTQITSAPGVHDGTFGPNELWVHNAHTLAGGPSFTVRRGTEVIGQLRSVAEAPPFEPNVEHVTVGELGYNAVVIRPRNFDASVRYPVIVSVYGGPGHPKVRKARDLPLREQWQADHGFIVVSLDGRGTPGRGREWERATSLDVITLPLQDQIAGLHALGARFPEMDLSRVGIYGWSFGGYFSAHAVMRHPDIFKVGVAGAPVCAWEDYDTHYTERYMGLLSENAEGYASTSVLPYAAQLERPLMVIHGTSDDNVYFVHAIKMSDALLRAGRPHEFVPLAGSTHMVADPNVAKALHGRIMRFLADGVSAN